VTSSGEANTGGSHREPTAFRHSPSQDAQSLHFHPGRVMNVSELHQSPGFPQGPFGLTITPGLGLSGVGVGSSIGPAAGGRTPALINEPIPSRWDLRVTITCPRCSTSAWPSKCSVLLAASLPVQAGERTSALGQWVQRGLGHGGPPVSGAGDALTASDYVCAQLMAPQLEGPRPGLPLRRVVRTMRQPTSAIKKMTIPPSTRRSACRTSAT
jgi:hypothetical protein